MCRSPIVAPHTTGANSNWGSVDKALKTPHLADAIFRDAQRPDLFNWMLVGTAWYNQIVERLYRSFFCITIKNMAAFKSLLLGFRKSDVFKPSDLIPKWTVCAQHLDLRLHTRFLASEFDLTWTNKGGVYYWPPFVATILEMSFLSGDRDGQPYSGLFEIVFAECSIGVIAAKPKIYEIEKYRTLRKSDADRWDSNWPHWKRLRGSPASDAVVLKDPWYGVFDQAGRGE